MLAEIYLVISIVWLIWVVQKQKDYVPPKILGPCTTIYGIFHIEDATEGIISHERAHFVTKTPWLILLSYLVFPTLLVLNYGIVKSFIIASIVNIAIRWITEAIADIAGMATVGIYTYWNDLEMLYFKARKDHPVLECITFFTMYCPLTRPVIAYQMVSGLKVVVEALIGRKLVRMPCPECLTSVAVGKFCTNCGERLERKEVW